MEASARGRSRRAPSPEPMHGARRGPLGDAEGRRSACDVTLFDSTGLAIQDLAIAKAAYANADELDLQTMDV